MGRIEKLPGKEAIRLHSDKPACPRRGNPTAVKTVLHCCQTERGGKDCWDAEQLDRDLSSRWSTRIASQPLCPREARVGTLRAGKDHLRFVRRSGGGRRQAHLDALVSHELYTGAPMLSAAPIPKDAAGRDQPGVDAAGDFFDAAWWWLPRATDTANALGSRDNRRFWRRPVGRNVLPAGQDSRPSPSWGKSWPRTDPLSRARRPQASHSPAQVPAKLGSL